MKTEIYLERPLLNGIIRQSNITGFFNVNDVLKSTKQAIRIGIQKAIE
jgi:hypothetical protein